MSRLAKVFANHHLLDCGVPAQVNGTADGEANGKHAEAGALPLPVSFSPAASRSPGNPRTAALLVFANKQDLPNAMNAAEITDKLGLHSLRQRHWYVSTIFCRTSTHLGILLNLPRTP